MSCTVRFAPVAAAAFVACLSLASAAHAQQLAGVYVDSDGVLRKQVYEDPDGQLMRARVAAAKAELPDDVAAPSKLRKVSLARLERALAERVDQDLPPTPDIAYLAGLTRVTHVFIYPDSGDLVLAGPAEGWTTDLSGRVRGIQSGRPTLELQDLAVALRMYPADEDSGPVIGCSIDPTPEGLARMQEFLADAYRRAQPTQQFADYVVQGLRTNLGLQQVRVLGVPPTTHFAQVLVEADYRMKLIGIGLEKPPVKLASYVDKANPADVAQNGLQRWYFTPDYECVRVADGGLAMQLVGEGVQLVGQDEVVVEGGRRAATGSTDRASQMFVTGFTKKYPQLADRSPVFAQLRNLIDLAIVAAFLQREGSYDQAGWVPQVLTDEDRYAVETYTAPVNVETVCTSVWKRGQLMTPVGGGVNIQAHLALEYENVGSDEDGQIEALRDELMPQLAADQWWWD